MGRSADGGRPVLDVVVAYWPVLILLPAILTVIVALVLVTRWWDLRDAARLAGEDVPTGWRVLARRPVRCTCSWHTVGTGVGTGGG